MGERVTGETSPAVNVLVPHAGAASTFPELLAVGRAILDSYGGSGTILSVVEVPEERSLSEGALVVQRRRRSLNKLAQLHSGEKFRAEVRTARSLQQGIRSAVEDASADLVLLSWNPSKDVPAGSALEELVDDPPCDVAVVKRGRTVSIESVLLPVRGGPHARLALQIAEAVASANDAVLTLLHVDLPFWSEDRRTKEDRFFSAVRSRIRYSNTREWRLEADSVESALCSAGAEHDLVVMGAAARDDPSTYLFGRIPSRVARKLRSAVVIVKTHEPVTLGTFGLPERVLEDRANQDISLIVDRWFAENTFHSHEFRGIRELIELKERQGTCISLALPTLNEEKTVGKILSTIKRQLVERFPLVDELIVIDSDSTDRTIEIVEGLDVPVLKHPDILPQYGSFAGKGEALWKSLFVTRGDIVVWVDSDITGFHPKFVYGLIGPLLTQPHLAFVKGFYRRPLNLGGHLSTTGGGRVTELTARPLINLFYPHLSGVVQPLAGEMAGRRHALETVPFFTGYGVETGLLLDLLGRFGLRCIAQTDLEERIHRNQTLLSLSKMAFAIVQVVIKRLGDDGRLALLQEMNNSMKIIHYSPTELFLEIQEIHEHERPPMQSLAEYVARAAGSVGDVVPRAPEPTGRP